MSTRIRRHAPWRKKAENTHLNFALPSGCTHADVVCKIAERLAWSVSVLPERFSATSLPRGRVVFSYAASVLDQISEQYELEWDAKDGVLQFSAAKPINAPAPGLSEREKKIWEVIQRGTTGLQYCRELSSAKVAPLRTDGWKDCPRSYVSAYLNGEPWRHRIQDEKCKIRRKAELAGLARE